MGAAQRGCAVGARSPRSGLVSTSVISGPWPALECDLSGLRVSGRFGGRLGTPTRCLGVGFGVLPTTTEPELDEAGKHFAEGLAKGDSRSLSCWSRTKPSSLHRESWRQSIHRRNDSASGLPRNSGRHSRKGKARSVQGEQTEAERRRAASEATPKERKALERLQDLRRTVEARGGMELGKDLNEPASPSAGHVVAIGVVGLVTGLFALAAAASQEDEQPRKRRSRTEEERAMSGRKRGCSARRAGGRGDRLTFGGLPWRSLCHFGSRKNRCPSPRPQPDGAVPALLTLGIRTTTWKQRLGCSRVKTAREVRSFGPS